MWTAVFACTTAMCGWIAFESSDDLLMRCVAGLAFLAFLWTTYRRIRWLFSKEARTQAAPPARSIP